jgi:uncharacterized coiled-coil protein SlyX
MSKQIEQIDEMAQILEKLRECMAKRDELEAQIEALKEQLQQKAKSVAAMAAVPTGPRETAGARRRGRAVRDNEKAKAPRVQRDEGEESLSQAIRAILRERAKPMHIDEIYAALAERRHAITQTQNPGRTLSKRIYILKGIKSKGESMFVLDPEYAK